MKFSFIFATALISLSCFAQDQIIPYDENKVPFDTNWCALPKSHQDLIKEVCYGYGIVEGDILVPGVQVNFNNHKSLTIGSLYEGWEELENNTYKLECVSAYKGHRYTLYETRMPNGYEDRVWLQLTPEILVETQAP